MSITLLPEEQTYLLELLSKQGWWWVRDKLIEKIQDDLNRRQKIQSCKHTFHKYTGHRECCSLCGAFDVGMGESWTLDDPTGDHNLEKGAELPMATESQETDEANSQFPLYT